MNNTVTLSQLITRLAKVADTDTNTSRRFLRTFFGAIEEALIAGESVTVKGIGTFRRSSDAEFGSASGISFVPDEQLAKELNVPFEMFQAVELADGVKFPEDEEESPAEEPAPQQPEEPAPVAAAPVAEPIHEAPAPALAPEPAMPKPEPQAEKPVPEEPHKAPWELDEFASARPKEPKQPLVTSREEPVKPVPPVFELADDEEEETVPQKKSWNTIIWIGVALMIAGGAACGYFAATYGDDDTYGEYTEEVTDSIAAPVIEEINVADAPETAATSPVSAPAPEAAAAPTTAEAAQVVPKAEPAPAAPAAQEPRYDTVSKTNYLAQMARRYYGHATYWVFIYEANTDIIKNPNRISPGTRVRIPYENELPGTDTAERKKIASRKCAELERKYK